MKAIRCFITIVATGLLFVNQRLAAQAIPQDSLLRTGKLANGLTYYIRHNERPKDRADFYLVQKVGSVLEQENQRGLAHFLEHMAFNGTTHFPGNSMVSELEKKGIKFGSNINASTGYDETIYKLNDIPVSRQGIIDTALLVLHDWSGFLLLDEKEINQERGVVKEEWRTRSNASLRVLESQVLPNAFAGSPYANRIPIGSMEVVDQFKPQELKDYYKKWYRPDLQGIIVVGDVNVDSIEREIKQLFADIPAAVNPAKRPYFEIPDNKEPVVITATDPELKRLEFDVYWKRTAYPKDQRSTVAYFEDRLIQQMIISMLSTRAIKLREKTKQPFSSLYFNNGNFMFVDNKEAFNLHVDAIDTAHIFEALQAGLEEAEKLRRFGFSPDEFNEYRKAMMNLNAIELADPEKKYNFQLVTDYTGLFLRNEMVPPDGWKARATANCLEQLTLDKLNTVARELVADSNMVIVFKYPQKAMATAPAKGMLLDTWKAVRAAKLSPFVFERENHVLPAIHPAAGKLIRTTKAAFGFTEWTFANGLRVQYKKIDFPDNNIVMYGYSPGGYSVISLADLPSAKMMNYLAFQKDIIDTTSQSTADLRVGEYDETVSGTAHTVKDVETMLLMTYLKMTTFKRDTLAFEKFMELRQMERKTRVKEPKDYFSDTIRSIMSNGNPRALVSTYDSACLANMNYDRMITLFRQRYANPGDFIFFIAGTMDIDSMKTLVSSYLGGLPGKNVKETVHSHGMYPPPGPIRKHFFMPMKTPQTTVTIGYTGKMAMSVQNRVLIKCLAEVLNMIFTDKLREEEGGTYGADVSGTMEKQPSERFIFQVNFDTDPAKRDKLIAIVYAEFAKIMREVPGEYLEKVKLHLLKSFREQSAEKNAAYWATQAYMLHVFGVDGRLDYEKIVSSITPEMVSRLARKIFKERQLIEVVMNPEVK